MPIDYLPVFLMVSAVSVLALVILFVSSLVRPSYSYPEQNLPSACGVDHLGAAVAGPF